MRIDTEKSLRTFFSKADKRWILFQIRMVAVRIDRFYIYFEGITTGFVSWWMGHLRKRGVKNDLETFGLTKCTGGEFSID